MPARLTPFSVATPLAFVVAPPTLVPLSVKLDGLAGHADCAGGQRRRQRRRAAVGARSPAPTASVVDVVGDTFWKQTVTDVSVGVTELSLVVR